MLRRRRRHVVFSEHYNYKFLSVLERANRDRPIPYSIRVHAAPLVSYKISLLYCRLSLKTQVLVPVGNYVFASSPL